MMASPRVSVVMSVYNGQTFLAEAVSSVLAQSMSDLEFIIVNDGSTDRSDQILQEFAHRDTRVRVITQRNAGLAAALNVGISSATAPYLARMDADDICLPHRLQRQVAYLDVHPECVVLGSGYIAIDPEGSEISIRQPPQEHEAIEKLLLAGSSIICHPTVMMRRDAVLRVGGYNAHFRYSQDYDLWLRMSEIGRIINLPEPLIRYRLHPASATYAQRQQQTEMLQAALRQACNRRGIQMPPPIIGPKYPGQPATPYAWWSIEALMAGHSTVSRRLARKAWREQPRSLRVWFACAIAHSGPVGRKIARRMFRVSSAQGSVPSVQGFE